MNEITLSLLSAVESASGFEQLESGAFDVVCRFGCRALARRLREFDDRIVVPSSWRSRGRRERSVVTRLGEVTISRRCYIDENGESRYPLDEHFTLAPAVRISPSIERSLVKLSASVSFREAAQVVSDLTGADVSHATAHMAVRRAGTRIALEQQAAASDLPRLGPRPGRDTQRRPASRRGGRDGGGLAGGENAER